MEYIIIFFPLIGSIVEGFFGKKLGDKYCQIFTSSLVAISGIFSLIIFYKVFFNDYFVSDPSLSCSRWKV